MTDQCQHANAILEDLDPTDRLGQRRFWCEECGALSERGGRHWRIPLQLLRRGMREPTGFDVPVTSRDLRRGT